MSNVAYPHFVRMTALLGCNGLLSRCESAISVNSSTSGPKQTKCLLMVNSLIPSVLGSTHTERDRWQMLPRSVSRIQRWKARESLAASKRLESNSEAEGGERLNRK